MNAPARAGGTPNPMGSGTLARRSVRNISGPDERSVVAVPAAAQSGDDRRAIDRRDDPVAQEGTA